MSEHKIKEKLGVPKPKSCLIAVPTFGLDPDPTKWLATFLGVVNEFSGRGFRLSMHFPYRRPIVEAENEIANLAITTGMDYIFRMDDDINGFQPGFVNKLIDADKEFISGVMFVAGFPYSRCAFKRKDPTKSLIEIYKNRSLALDEVEGEGVVPCDLTATPFTLIKTSIFEKIMTPYYETKDGVAMDSVFCQKLLDAGIQPYAHMGVEVGHRHVMNWNRHYLFNAEARALLKSKMVPVGSELYAILSKEFGPTGELDILQIKGVKIRASGTEVAK